VQREEKEALKRRCQIFMGCCEKKRDLDGRGLGEMVKVRVVGREQ
jgi:hypothetical protein